MKKLFFCAPIILSALLLSCSQANSNKDGSRGSDSSTANNANSARDRMIANDRRINKALETGNFDGIDTLWTDDIVDHTGPMGKEVRGKDSVKAELIQMTKLMKDIKIDPKVYAYDPEKGYLFSWSHFTATTTAPMQGMPSNTKVDMNSVDVVKIKNGKATDHWTFNDPNEMMKMMNGQKNMQKNGKK